MLAKVVDATTLWRPNILPLILVVRNSAYLDLFTYHSDPSKDTMGIHLQRPTTSGRWPCYQRSEAIFFFLLVGLEHLAIYPAVFRPWASFLKHYMD